VVETTLQAIAIHTAVRGAVTELTEALVTPECGVEGDMRGKPGRRQVTVLSSDAWQAACRDLDSDLPWTLRRANFLVSGIDLAQSAGSQLHIDAVVLEISCETDPCKRMDEQYPGLRQALAPDWRGGVCCRVLIGGTVCVGDHVELQAST
jgi:MOSC domain-containing protein YiiM